MSRPFTLAAPAALLAALAMLVGGCSSDGESAPGSSVSEQSESAEPAGSDPASDPAGESESTGGDTQTGEDLDPNVDEFVSEFKEVQGALETYWTSKIDGYEKPARTIVFGGESDDPSTYPSCGGEQVESENGFYCPPDNTVILDAEWMYGEYKRIGDSFLYVVLAHEYGHSAQANLSEENQPAEADEEVQADCFSGSFWQESVDSGEFQEEDGDEQEINLTLASVAGDFGTSDNHGTLAARAGAFEYGRSKGAQGCLDTSAYVR